MCPCEKHTERHTAHAKRGVYEPVFFSFLPGLRDGPRSHDMTQGIGPGIRSIILILLKDWSYGSGEQKRAVMGGVESEENTRKSVVREEQNIGKRQQAEDQQISALAL
jgi:hypothetical protein